MNKDVFTWASVDTAAARSDHPAFSSLFFSGSNKQRQTWQQPHVPALGKCYNLQAQLFMTPVHGSFFFFFLQAVWSHIYLPYYDVTPWRVSFLWVCFYLSNTETMNQHYYSMQEMGAKVWQIEVAYPFVMMVTNGSPGHLLCLQWSTTLAEAVMLMMKYTYKYTLACMVCLLLRLFPRLSLRPQRNVFTSAVTCRCGSQNEIQGPFVPISFSYQAKCSLETGLITWHDPQSR